VKHYYKAGRQKKKSAEALSVPNIHASDHTLLMQTLAIPWDGLAMREKAP
jgi:hypothetical protein